MATFTNYATLSYNGGTVDSNTVVGELVETLSVTKSATPLTYEQGDIITYIVSIVNSGATASTSLTLTDDLGAYAYGTLTLYPLAYVADSVRVYAGGVQQTAPTVTAGPPLTISGIEVGANSDILIVYRARVTQTAPLGTSGQIVNTVTVAGNGASSDLTASTTITAEQSASLRIRKSLSPTSVAENGQVTYTFVIENTGTLPADASQQIILTDTFTPRLRALSATYNGTVWTAGVNYNYNATTGVFTSLAGQITVPAATYPQTAGGTWQTTPGTATITVTGTI